MFIRIFIKILPLLFIIQAYSSENDSVYIYWQLGLDSKNATKYEISEIYFKKAINYSNNKNLTASTLNELGVVYMLQGKYQQAIDKYEKGKQLTNDSTLLSNINVNIGIIYKKTGDTEKAKLLYLKALETANEGEFKALIYNNIANIYYGQKKYYDALEYYLRSYDIFKVINRKNLIYIYLNIALCYQELGKIDEVEGYFTKTIQERIKLFGNKHNRLIIAYLNYGNFLIESNHKKSFSLLSKANDLAILNYGEKHPETAKTYHYLGNYYFAQKEYEKALENHQNALISNSEKFNDPDYSQNPNIGDAISKLHQLDIFHKKAVALKHYGNSQKDQKILSASLITYELAIQALFKLQNSFMDESKRTLIANKKDMFAEAAYIAIQLGDYSKAFQLIEKGKASTLLAAVNNNEAIRFSNIPDSLVELENEYKRLQFVHTANNNTDSLLIYQARHDSLIEYFETNYKKYYSLKYGNDFPDPCKHLDTNQVLLEYALTDTLCITLVATKEGYMHHNFKIDSNFTNKADAFIRHLREMKYVEGYQEQYDDITSYGYYLWEKMIKPLNIPEGKSLIIIPDGILAYLNFEALLYDLPKDKDVNYFALKYLLYKYPISYGYSASWLFEPYNEDPGKNIIAFAADYRDKDNIGTLESSIVEAKKITRFFRGRSYLNKECTKSTFFTNAPDYRVIHLSLHGDIVEENSSYSKLGFHDADLYSWEVYGMNLKARMAYLSACKTGDGKLDKGEGIFSMGRAFAYAGCPTIVMSLWTDKDNMPHLILDYYKYLRKGYPLDKAMQLAKINHLKQSYNVHPHFWSNKIIMGKTTPIKSGNKFYWLFTILIIPIIVLFVKKK